jgi:chemotaxis protein methyltransferase CheR
MALSQASFEYIRGVLRERAAQALEDDKGYLVEVRLLPVARRHGLESVDALVHRLQRRTNEKLLREVVEAMAISETSFFRDGHPFEALRQIVLPDLIERRASVRRLSIWSAATSSGQEAYSLAILLNEHFPALGGWEVRILASDLSAAILERARRGCYSELEIARGLSPEVLAKYFRKTADGWQIDEAIRRRVEFQLINLGGVWPVLPPLDLVLLRNVLIYFDAPTRQRLLQRIRRVLQPDGYLLLGGAETTHNLDDDFLPVAYAEGSVFRLRAAGV